MTIEDYEFEDIDRGISIGNANHSDTSLVNSWWIRENSFILRDSCDMNSSTESDTTSIDADEVGCEGYALQLAGGTGNIEFAYNNIGSVFDSGYSPSGTSSCSDEDAPTEREFYLGVKVDLSKNDTPDLHDNKDQSNNSLPAANATNKKIFPA